MWGSSQVRQLRTDVQLLSEAASNLVNERQIETKEKFTLKWISWKFMRKFTIGKLWDRASVTLIVVYILTGMLTRRSEVFPAFSLVRYSQKISTTSGQLNLTRLHLLEASLQTELICQDQLELGHGNLPLKSKICLLFNSSPLSPSSLSIWRPMLH